MKSKTSEIKEELASVLSGKTIDALIPPLVYAGVNALFGLDTAVIAALLTAIVLGLWRMFLKQTWIYALGGMLGVILAAGLAFLTRNAVGFFLPGLISSSILLFIALSSLLIGKPLAAWASHLTRGWPLHWFWRKDIKPAYREVTLIWALFIGGRFAIQVLLYQRGQASELAWANTLLGWPVTIMILVVSYVYGIYRLKNLGGPGVDEFIAGDEPPWVGQTRGF